MRAQAVLVGEKVLAGFAKGRQRAIQQAKARSAPRKAAIILLYNEDVAKGKPAWGRAGRIRRRMTKPPSERQVKRILDQLIKASE
jgi:hypothetical protein